MTNSQTVLLERLRAILVQLGIASTAVSPDAHFMRDLGMDSLDIVDLLMRLETGFGLSISDDQMSDIHTVGDAIRFLSEKTNNGSA